MPSLRQCSNSQNNSFHVRKGNYLNMLSAFCFDDAHFFNIEKFELKWLENF